MNRDKSSGYEEFFGFEQMPFSIAPDTRFRFQSTSHATALDQVTYALKRREPVIVVTGDIGTGKTLLCRTVVEQLERQTFLSVISDPLLEFDELVKQMLQDFGVVSKDRASQTPTSRHDLIHALQDFFKSLISLRAHAVVIIDEAQHLRPDVLEHLRLVSNVHDDRGTLLQIILVGQTDLDQLLSRSELRPVKQRVSRSVPLGALSPPEVAKYIDHRLTVARQPAKRSTLPGARELERELAESSLIVPEKTTFTPEAVNAVAQLSRGIPRVVNLLCDRALEAAYTQDVHAVDASLIGSAARALSLQPAAAVIESPAKTTPIEPPVKTAPIEPPAKAAPIAPPVKAAPIAPPVKATPIAPPVKATPIAPPATAAAIASSPTISTPQTRTPPWASEPVPDSIMFGASASSATQTRRYALLAASVVLVVAAIWFAARAIGGGAASETSAPQAPVQTSPAAPPAAPAGGGAPTTAQPPANPSAPDVRTLPEPTGTAATSTTSPAAAPSGTAAGDSFEIVIASFRTTTRANEVASAVTALGQPVRQRLANGWQQVLAGPYQSAAAARDAQERLEQAGYTNTQLVVVSR